MFAIFTPEEEDSTKTFGERLSKFKHSKNEEVPKRRAVNWF